MDRIELYILSQTKMKYKVWDIVVMKIIPITTEWPSYTARMREIFINNPEVRITDIIDRDVIEYYVKDYRGNPWRILEKWIENGKTIVSYFIS